MGYDGKYGNQQSYGNKNGSAGRFQNKFEDKTEIPEPVKVQSFYKPDGKTLKEDLFESMALDVAKSFKGKNKKGNDIGVTSTQLRRIFDEVKRFEQILMLQKNQL